MSTKAIVIQPVEFFTNSQYTLKQSNDLSLDDFNEWMTFAVNTKKIAAVDKQLVRFFLRNIHSSLDNKSLITLSIFLCFISTKMTKGNVCVLLKESLLDLFDDGFYLLLPSNFQAVINGITTEHILRIMSQENLAIINANDADWLTIKETLQEIPPIIVVANRLYFQRMWQDEYTVASFFLKDNAQIPPDIAKVKSILNKDIFVNPKETPDRQKIASVIALRKPVSIISGGPGTGKTRTVAAILLAAIRLNADKKLRILLAAPTGKAAARLTESLLEARNSIMMSEEEKDKLALEALTLHRLLGASHLGDAFIHNKHHPLNGDILIVDEASMIDLRLMAKLIEAIPKNMKLILLGDRDQLSSVAPGRVLGELCSYGGLYFSEEMATALSEVLEEPIALFYDKQNVLNRHMADMIGFLTFSRRFPADSKIGQLARAMNNKAIGEIATLLNQNECQYSTTQQQFEHFEAPLRYINTNSTDEHTLIQVYHGLLKDCLLGFKAYIEEAKKHLEFIAEYSNSGPINDVISAFNKFRVLCAIHHGPYGTVALNQAIRVALYEAELIDSLKETHYFARPILITRNDKMLGLFNGDIGITLKEKETGLLKVYFKNPQGKIVSVSPSRLPEHETAFAMTVHKSQGSEFQHTLLVMPSEPNPVLTKELVYTGVTRASKQLTLYGTLPIIFHAVNHQTPRSSGLIEQINALTELYD
ncbi:exodeoxyribonuclease V subunit alpha [Thorsellia kenyensis]|uniref:RecBCD enzyme subunit RecD n=1 Tax=Thorsellia kenyensis TaxID=1549888 RepID=A0ABV6CBI2_9GAMM